MLLNADDPRVAALGEGLAARVVYYGVEDRSLGSATVPHAADSRFCVRCGTPYNYDVVFYSQILKGSKVPGLVGVRYEDRKNPREFRIPAVIPCGNVFNNRQHFGR